MDFRDYLKTWTPPHRLVKVYPATIPNINRVQRILNLIVFLSDHRTRKQIAQHLNISVKTVSRYINLLTVLGFDVDIMFTKEHCYKITNSKDYFKIK